MVRKLHSVESDDIYDGHWMSPDVKYAQKNEESKVINFHWVLRPLPFLSLTGFFHLKNVFPYFTNERNFIFSFYSTLLVTQELYDCVQVKKQACKEWVSVIWNREKKEPIQEVT